MKINMGGNNQKGPQNKIILGVVGVVALVAVIVVAGMFTGKGKSPDDPTKEVITEEVDGEDVIIEEVDGKGSVDGEVEDVVVVDGEDGLPVPVGDNVTLAKDDDKYKDSAGGVTETDIGKGGKTETVKQYKIGDTVKLGKFEVTINSAKKVKADDGKDAVVIDYNLKNKSLKSANWSTAILTHVAQDGKELVRANVKGANDADIKNVKGNKTMKGIKDAFVIGNDKQIFLEITELTSNKHERALVVFDVPSK